MKNIIDYAETEQRSFKDKEFCAVDSLILSEMSYRNLGGIVPDLYEGAAGISFAEMVNTGREDQLLQSTFKGIENKRRLLHALKNSERFRDVQLAHYVNQSDVETEKQFAAVTYLLNDGTAYIAYRGTDYTMIGFKEDLNMAFISPIPSQEEGVTYLNTVAERTGLDLRVGGHSKGGNVAVYASMLCEPSTRQRIRAIYSHDGPGFHDEVFNSVVYQEIKDRIQRTLPQASLVGMLMQQHGEYAIVESNGFWVLQHDPFTWLTEGDDFCYARRFSNSSRYLNVTLSKWIDAYDNEKRALFVDTLYEVITATNVTSLSDFTEDWRNKALAVLSGIKGLDRQTRQFIRKAISTFIVLSIKNIPQIPRRNN